MAFPTVATASFSPESVNTTTHDVVVPTGTSSGDLMVAIFGLDSVEPVLNMPGGWVSILEETGSGGQTLSLWYKIAGASESDFTYDTAGAETSANRVLRITNWHGTTPPEGDSASGSSANANPPSLNPSGWGTEDTLWIACYSIDGNATASAYPTNYDDNQFTDHGGSAGAPAIANATRELAAASEDPGTFTHTAEQWGAGTMAVRPAGVAPSGNPWYAYAQQ